MHYHRLVPTLLAAITLAIPTLTSALAPAPQKDYLTEAEAEKIRYADTPSERIKLFMSFAEDRLMKFEYELNRKVPEMHRSDLLNALLNGYSGSIDDAADQIDVAQEKQIDIRGSLKMMKKKDQEFLETLQKYAKNGPELASYKDTLEDAIEGTKDALSDISDAEKEATPGPVRRKP